MKPIWLAPLALAVFVFPRPARSGPACNAKLAFHIQAPPAKGSEVTQNCNNSEVFNVSGSLGANANVYLLVSTPGGVQGVKFGIDYDDTPGSGMFLEQVNGSGPYEIGSLGTGIPGIPDWPAPGSGAMVTFDCQTGDPMRVLDAFYIYAYTDQVMRVVGHPYDGEISVFGCNFLEENLPVTSVGSVGFGSLPGINPCNTPTDTDGDGVPDLVEMNTLIGAETDAKVVSYQVPGSSPADYITLTTDVGAFSCVRAWDPSDEGTPGGEYLSPPPGPAIAFPVGLVSFELAVPAPGDVATVTVDVPAGYTMPQGYKKFGLTPGHSTRRWYSLDPVVVDVPSRTLTVELVDGKTGDDDLVPDGVIRDLGGPSKHSITGVREPGPVAGLTLAQNRPNPVRAATRISFTTARPGPVSLRIFDVTGREVARPYRATTVDPGPHETFWDACDPAGRRVAAGVYYYRLAAPEGAVTRKLLVLP